MPKKKAASPPRLEAGIHVHFRAFGAERSGVVLAPGDRKNVKLRWRVPQGGQLEDREKWVPIGVIYRAVDLTREPADRLPTRSGPFYCMDATHSHPTEYVRDECVRETGGWR